MSAIFCSTTSHDYVACEYSSWPPRTYLLMSSSNLFHWLSLYAPFSTSNCDIYGYHSISAPWRLITLPLLGVWFETVYHTLFSHDSTINCHRSDIASYGAGESVGAEGSTRAQWLGWPFWMGSPLYNASALRI